MLSYSFNVENKGVFPFPFLKNTNIPLDYNGKLPDIKYYIEPLSKEYKEYCEFNNII